MDNCNDALVTFKVLLLSPQGEVKETRRFSIARGELNAAKLYNCLGAPFVLTYRDCDGDSCSIRTDADVEEMMRLYKGGNLIKLNAAMISSSNSICASVKPHIKSAQNIAASAAEEVKKAAEEALVLGVRGYSYAQDQWNRTTPPAVTAPIEKPKEHQPLVKKVAEEAIVLGMRGYSYAQHQLSGPNPAPLVPLKETQEEKVVEKDEGNSYVMEQRLNELSAMGFADRTKNKALLIQHNMDLTAAVAALLDV